MPDSGEPRDIPEALPAGPAPRERRCSACGSEDVVKLGRKFEGVQYIAAESETSFFALARGTQANLWVCLDCGFLGWFMRRDELNGLRERHGR